jgi:transcription-repair coupling factor (superfamily II helicase)
MHKQAKLDTTGIPEIIQDYDGALRFQFGETPYLHYIERRKKNNDCTDMMALAKQILERLAALALQEE